MSKQRMDSKKVSHKFVVTGLIKMIEDDGLTPHEAFEVLEDIKNQTYFALAEIHRERKGVTK